jgi:demethylmenaquinone methyltransferase/2-methoxy-6-polyprenyl-1,4-benzoquinol methylase
MSEKVRSMFASIAARYDITNTILSLGTHHLWRSITVKESGVSAGQHVLDCATGTGDLALAFKKSVGKEGVVIGTDFCKEMLDLAPVKAAKEGLDVTFEIADAMNLPYESNRFDVASISFGIRNVDDPLICLKEMARVVRPGGKVVVLEFGQPKGLFKYIYAFYQKYIMPLIGGLLTGNKAAYIYLPETSARFPSGNDFLELMHKTGAFSEMKFRPLTFGIAYIYVGTVKA